MIGVGQLHDIAGGGQKVLVDGLLWLRLRRHENRCELFCESLNQCAARYIRIQA